MTLISGLMTFPAGASREGAQQSQWVMDLTLAGSCDVYSPSYPHPITLQPGDVILVRPDVFLRWKVPKIIAGGRRRRLGMWRVVWFVFTPHEQLLEWLQFAEVFPGFHRLTLKKANNRRHVREALLKANKLGASPLPEHGDLALNALAEAILWCRYDQRQMLKQVDERVQNALSHLNRRLSDSTVRIADVVRASHTSRSRLLHLFRHQVGMPIMDYLEHERMRRSRQLLEYSALSVKEVAKEVGYQDPKHFARNFRKKTGVSPRAWRQRQKP